MADYGYVNGGETGFLAGERIGYLTIIMIFTVGLAVGWILGGVIIGAP